MIKSFNRTQFDNWGKLDKDFPDLLEMTKNDIKCRLGITNDIKILNGLTLEVIFNVIDKHYMNNFFKLNYAGKFCFRMSSRLTSSAGNIRSTISTCEFNIAISTPIMNNFGKINSSSIVNGLECKDRMECIISVMQHEMVHAIQIINTRKADHGQDFKAIASRLFGHTETKHRMATHKTVAREVHDLRVGTAVKFSVGSTVHVGRIERITKRATVRTFEGLKFYVPLTFLERAG